MRDRRMPKQNRTVRTFEDCLDENSYEMLPIPDVSREYTVTVKKGVDNPTDYNLTLSNIPPDNVGRQHRMNERT